MKNKLQIAHRWKTIGWILTIPALAAGLFYLSSDQQDFITVTIPDWLSRFMWIESFMSNTKAHEISLLDEIICLSLMTGLLLLAFSREKVEDEWIQQVRLESFQWAILVNALLLMAFTIFTHGMPFLTVMVYNMFTPLLIFVGRFYYVLHLKPMLFKN